MNKGPKVRPELNAAQKSHPHGLLPMVKQKGKGYHEPQHMEIKRRSRGEWFLCLPLKISRHTDPWPKGEMAFLK